MLSSSIFDVKSARRQFPALREPQVYLDNAGGTQVLGTVIESIKKYLSESNVQLGATYAIGEKSTALYTRGQHAAARYINAEPDEVVFGPSATQLFRNLSISLQFKPGDELIISKLDHEANIAPWVQIAKRCKLVVKWWTTEKATNPKLEASSLKRLLSEKTRLVTCTHASNILGTIHDIRKIADAVHTVPGAMLCVDGVAYAPHRHVDMRALDVDFYSFSWYKVYGPHIAMLYAKRSVQSHMQSLGHFFKPGKTLEDKLGLAGASYELAQSIPAIIEYLGPDPVKTWRQIAAHEERIQSILLAYLVSRGDATVYGETSGSSDSRVPVISFTVKRTSAPAIIEAVEKKSNFGFRYGHMYSKRLVNDILGLNDDGVVRVSLVHYNTEQEVQELLKLLDKVLPRL